MNQKVVGQPCPDCGTPYIQGKTGAYCKPCYIKWANQNKQQKNDTPDWEAINRGKVRHGLFCAFIQGKTMSQLTEEEMKSFYTKLINWENIIMRGTPRQTAQEIPTIQVEEEIPLDEIPF